MKIGHFEPKTAPTNATPVDRKTGPAGAAQGVEPSAKVELSSAGALQATGADEAAFDSAKVDRIATAIREGRFQVDAGAIADKLITNAQELLGRSSN